MEQRLSGRQGTNIFVTAIFDQCREYPHFCENGKGHLVSTPTLGPLPLIRYKATKANFWDPFNLQKQAFPQCMKKVNDEEPNANVVIII